MSSTEPDPVGTRLTAAYAAHRGALLGVAYRMLGQFGDAEDVVQQAFVRYRDALAAGTVPDSERAYLTTITTRLAIDHLRSARVRREVYPGPWLPEPAVDGLTDLSEDAALADSLSTAFLVMLERLSPEQRAVLLLHDVFGLTFAEIAPILGSTPAACRQLGSRARRAVRTGRPRYDADRGAADRLAGRFFAAAREGDLAAVTSMLTEDAEFVGDGGGSGRGLARPVHGQEAVAKVLQALLRQVMRYGGRLAPTRVGSEPGVLLLAPDDSLVGVWVLSLAGEKVHSIHGIVNPDKLRHLGLPVLTGRVPPPWSQDAGPGR